jgi:hypothetical protein
MDDQIITIYVLCDEALCALGHRQDPQCVLSDAEVMTMALVSARFFHGNFETGCGALQLMGYMPRRLSRSQFNRRLHRLGQRFVQLFSLLGQIWKQQHPQGSYVLDSFPIAACDNIRIRRCRLYQDACYRGYCASKRRYFYGLKLHLMITSQGQPIELFFSPGSLADVQTLHWFSFDLPAGSVVYADSAYTEYGIEDLLDEALQIRLLPVRKSNSKRPLPAYVHFVQNCQRKQVETTGSLIERLLPKHIHAVTAKGFELKLLLFVLAYSISCG